MHDLHRLFETYGIDNEDRVELKDVCTITVTVPRFVVHPWKAFQVNPFQVFFSGLARFLSYSYDHLRNLGLEQTREDNVPLSIVTSTQDGLLDLTALISGTHALSSVLQGDYCHLLREMEQQAFEKGVELGDMTLCLHRASISYEECSRLRDTQGTFPRFPYASDAAVPLYGNTADNTREDLNVLLCNGSGGYLPSTRFARRVAYPLLRAWEQYQYDEDTSSALETLSRCEDAAWREVCAEWLNR